MSDHQFWQDKWQRGDISFHCDDVNPTILKYFPDLDLAPGSKVLVPLCGKSLDMLWFVEQGYTVVGIELSEIAVVDFFEQHKIDFQSESLPHATKFISSKITIIQGDMMALTEQDIVPCDAYYDRAALVALKPEQRKAYAAQVWKFLKPDAQGLVSILDYEYKSTIGPPYNISAASFEKLYHQFQINQLYDNAGAPAPKSFIKKNLLATVRELVFEVRKLCS